MLRDVRFIRYASYPDPCNRTEKRRPAPAAIHEQIYLEGERLREPRTEDCANGNSSNIWWVAATMDKSQLHRSCL